VRQQFARFGVGEGAVQFLPKRPRQAYLEMYNLIDVALDPFPYNGGVTSCDALWMGVPVIALTGEDYRSRQGLMLLSNIGVPELAAHSIDEYVNAAVDLAGDRSRLRRLRLDLRRLVVESAVGDRKRFCSELEAAYTTMWLEWCAKK
jgi:protein O-GlcNAc transferase